MAKKLNPFLKNDTNDLSKNIQNNIENELMDISLDTSNTKDFSQFLESSSEEYIQHKFNNSSLNIILTESFEIKSSYKNFNELSKGDIINNSIYKIFIENLLKLKSNIFNDYGLEPFILKISEKCKKSRKLGDDLINYSPGKNKSNKDIFCKIKNSSNQLMNMNKQNKILPNNINKQLKKNKSACKLEIDKFDKMKLNELNKNKTEHQSENNEEKLTIDIDNTKPNIYKKAKKSKNSFKLKNIEIPAKSNVINIIGDKSFSSSKNNFKDFDKEDSSKINKLHLLNAKKNINSAFINNNYDVENKREKNCIAF
jgi:predicted RNase H-like nuclease (RuvC/YqgF family)